MTTQMDTPVNPLFRGKLRRLGMLMRRELWEHRHIWVLPLILTSLVLAGSLLALVLPGRIDANLRSNQSTIHFNGSDSEPANE